MAVLRARALVAIHRCAGLAWLREGEFEKAEVSKHPSRCSHSCHCMHPPSHSVTHTCAPCCSRMHPMSFTHAPHVVHACTPCRSRMHPQPLTRAPTGTPHVHPQALHTCAPRHSHVRTELRPHRHSDFCLYLDPLSPLSRLPPSRFPDLPPVLPHP